MVYIRPATMEDLPFLLAIEQMAYKEPWTESMMRHEIEDQDHAHVVVLTSDDHIIGYLCFWLIDEMAMINKITVVPPLQGKKLGSLLLTDGLERFKKAGVQVVTLEVRVSNSRAQNLYLRHGFRILGTRKKYYGDGEDAYVMEYRFPEGDAAYEEHYISH